LSARDAMKLDSRFALLAPKAKKQKPGTRMNFFVSASTGSALYSLRFVSKTCLIIIAFLCVYPRLGWAISEKAVSPSSSPPTLATAQQKLAAMRVSFVPNAGQWDARAAFAAQTFAGTLFVTTEGQMVYSLPAKRIDAPAGVGAVHGTGANASDPSPFKGDGDTHIAFGSGKGMGFGGSANLLAKEPHPHPRPPLEGEGAKRGRTPGWVLTETLVDANGQPRSMRQSTLKAPAGYGPMEGKVSYATAQHTENLNTYERVNLGEMYPGINVQLRATHTKAGGNVEKVFTVAPNHDPKQIQIKLAGAQKLEINSKGELIAHTGNGPVAFTAPIAFQENDQGERVSVAVAYALTPSPFKGEARRGMGFGSNLAPQSNEPHPHPRPPLEGEGAETNATTYTFTLGAYDAARPLTIDPLLASTYLGGTAGDQINAIVVHPHSGQVYVAGFTQSLSFPQSSGGAQTSVSGTSCFVSRYSADLQQLLQSTYLGNGNVRCRAIATHPGSGVVYVAGSARSTSSFPAGSMTDAIQATHADSGDPVATDGFVALLSADLRTLSKATLFGGVTPASEEQINAIAVHPLTGFVHIVGTTSSSTLPGTVGGTQTTPGGGSVDAFTARLPADLMGPAATSVRYTFIGGNNNDLGNALAIDSRTGDVFVAGYSGGGFPPAMLSGAAQGTHAGSGDAFVARLKQDLSAVVRATYLGGSAFDEALSIALYPHSGEVLVAGTTVSSNLPLSAGGAQPAFAGGTYDGFVGRLSADLTAILQTTYLGGTADDCQFACQIAIHPISGEVFVAGDTTGNLLAALVADGNQSIYGGASFDAFIVRLNAALTARRAGTYLGGAGQEASYAIAIEPNGGSVYVAGFNNSGGFPTVNAPQGTFGGNGDGFVSRLSTDLTAVNRTPNPFSFIHQSNVPPASTRTSNEVQIIITPTPPDNHQVAYVSGGANSEFCVTNTAGCCLLAAPATSCSGFASGWITAPYEFLSGDRIAVRHSAAFPSGTEETRLIISGTAYPFRSSTGNANIACNLDMNADNNLSATIEGLILVRAMLGFSSAATVAGTGVTQGNWDGMRPQINANCGTNF
jgi:hypothetical protein